jgi:ATP-dependent DNA helicase Rep
MSFPARSQDDVLAPFGLSGDRLRIAQSDDEHLVVLAGPGAGKTHLLVAHACWLARHHAGRVIMLTFTKKAAGEMGQRVARVLSPSEARRVVASTIHAYAMSLLRAHGHHVGLPRNLQTLESRDVQEIADHLASSHRLPQMDDFARRFERYQRLRGDIDAPNAPPLLPLVVAEMRRTGNLDWETCIRFGTQLLNEHAQIRDSIRHHDRFVLLDEAQDCDPAQLAFVDALVGGPDGSGHLLVAMDPDQSLYAFRQADPARVRAWADAYARTPVELSENYRCQPRVQALASHVLGRPWDGPIAQGRAALFAARDWQDEARFVEA